jgi:hypothetical protein
LLIPFIHQLSSSQHIFYHSTCPKLQHSPPKLPSRNSLSPFAKLVSRRFFFHQHEHSKLTPVSDAPVRDDYESKKADYETEISELLGFPVKININVNAVWAYAQDAAATQAGSTFSG